MKITNGWKAFNKQLDKLCITLRVSFITFFSLKFDVSKKEFKLTILNFSLEK